MRSRAIIYLLLISGFSLLKAQVTDFLNGHDPVQTQVQKLSEINDSIFNIHENLLNGRIYTGRGDKINHPFFIENSWNPGKVCYSGTVSEEEILKYDISTDNLIILFNVKGSAYPVSINRDIVKEFYLRGHHFILLEGFKCTDGQNLIPGYYEIIFDGKLRFYIRHEKKENFNRLNQQQEYSGTISFYLKKDGNFVRIKKRKDLLKALNDQKDEIKSFIRENDLHISLNNIESVINILEFYDNL